MDIRILSDGPCIYAMYEGDDKLNKKEADELFEYILITFFNIIIRSRERKYFGCY